MVGRQWCVEFLVSETSSDNYVDVWAVWTSASVREAEWKSCLSKDNWKRATNFFNAAWVGFISLRVVPVRCCWCTGNPGILAVTKTKSRNWFLTIKVHVSSIIQLSDVELGVIVEVIRTSMGSVLDLWWERLMGCRQNDDDVRGKNRRYSQRSALRHSASSFCVRFFFAESLRINKQASKRPVLIERCLQIINEIRGLRPWNLEFSTWNVEQSTVTGPLMNNRSLSPGKYRSSSIRIWFGIESEHIAHTL